MSKFAGPPISHAIRLTSFVTRIDSFLSVSCCVCIVYDAHGVTNARYRHNSTDTHLKRDPRHPTYHLRNTLVPHLPTSDVIPSRQHHTHSKILHRECLGLCSSRSKPISDRKPPSHSSQTKRRIASCFIAPRRDETHKKYLIRLFAQKRVLHFPQRLTTRREHLTPTHTALEIVTIRPGPQFL